MHLMPLPFPRRKRNRSATADSLAAKIVTSQPRSRRVEGHRKNGNARLLFIYRFASSSVLRTGYSRRALGDGMCITMRVAWLTIDRLRNS